MVLGCCYAFGLKLYRAYRVIIRLSACAELGRFSGLSFRF